MDQVVDLVGLARSRYVSFWYIHVPFHSCLTTRFCMYSNAAPILEHRSLPSVTFRQVCRHMHVLFC